MRRLQVTVAGRWFLALTVALGVVALMSENNIIYLIESLLLSGLILSGVLSERSISALAVTIKRYPASANANVRDQVYLSNRKKFPLFCVEIGEWSSGKFVPVAFVPRLGSNSTVTVPSRQTFEKRGVHRWQGVAVATSYPFGFARKIRIIFAEGERIIWPSSMGDQGATQAGAARNRAFHTGSEIADGEVRQYGYDDDCRLIVWTLSAKGGPPLVRLRKSDSDDPDVILDLRTDPGLEFEKWVASAAKPFFEQDASASEGMLTVIEHVGKRRLHGKTRVLNELAVIEAQGVLSA